jgi:hypothetical protein
MEDKDGDGQDVGQQRVFRSIHTRCSGQVKTDTLLSHSGSGLEFHRTGIPEIRMPPAAVIEHLDVIDHVSFRFCPGRVESVVGPLAFQATEEALHHGIIPTLASAAHAAANTVLR